MFPSPNHEDQTSSNVTQQLQTHVKQHRMFNTKHQFLPLPWPYKQTRTDIISNIRVQKQCFMSNATPTNTCNSPTVLRDHSTFPDPTARNTQIVETVPTPNLNSFPVFCADSWKLEAQGRLSSNAHDSMRHCPLIDGKNHWGICSEKKVTSHKYASPHRCFQTGQWIGNILSGCDRRQKVGIVSWPISVECYKQTTKGDQCNALVKAMLFSRPFFGNKTRQLFFSYQLYSSNEHRALRNIAVLRSPPGKRGDVMMPSQFRISPHIGQWSTPTNAALLKHCILQAFLLPMR